MSLGRLASTTVSGRVPGTWSTTHEYPPTPEPESVPGFQVRSTVVSPVGVLMAGAAVATEASASGARVSRTIVVWVGLLETSISFMEVRLMGFSPSTRSSEWDQMVPSSGGQIVTPSNSTDVLGSLVPVRSWGVWVVGDVTGSRPGAVGTEVSTIHGP